MSKISLIKTSFNAGQLSPTLEGRIDLDKYANGCRTLQNFIPLAQGPIIKRPGTQFISSTKNNGKVWLAKFEFTFQQAFILEFGDQYIRFYADGGQVLNNNVPYEVKTPYSLADLTTIEGTFALSMVQSNDIIFITHRKYKPAKLSRLSNTNWTFTEVNFVGGPFQDQNKDTAIQVAVAGTTIGSSASLGCNVAIFDSNMEGQLFQLEIFDEQTPQWQELQDVTANIMVTNDNKFYKSLTAGKTGYVAPIHTKGNKYDGTQVQWQYVSSRIGIVKITSVISPTQATGVVVQPFPYGYITSYWSKAAFGFPSNFPEQVGFFRERLVFARDQKIWFSVAGDYENFAAMEFGEVLTDSAISIDITSEDASPIKYLLNTPQGLICGTNSDQILVTNASISQPFGPDNVRVSPGSSVGVRQINPVKIDQSILIIQRSGTKLLNLQYDDNSDIFVSSDLTLIAEDILSSGVVDIAWQRDPWYILWIVKSDGQLVGFTYNQQQQVQCFHPHFTDGFVESVQSIPSPDGLRDDIWLVVNRTINNNTVRYIELLQPEYQVGDDAQLLWYSDCARSYIGASTNIISGLNYLTGKTVQILANGAYHPPVIVDANGQITLNFQVTKAVIGLSYTCIMETLKLEGGANNGTSQGKMKVIDRIILRLLSSMGEIECAPSLNGNQNGYFDVVNFRDTDMRIDLPPPIFSGDKIVELSSEYNRNGQICIKQHQPFPFTILSIMPDMSTSER